MPRCRAQFMADAMHEEVPLRHKSRKPMSLEAAMVHPGRDEPILSLEAQVPNSAMNEWRGRAIRASVPAPLSSWDGKSSSEQEQLGKVG